MIAQKTPPRKKTNSFLEDISFRAIRWVGSVQSLIFHTTLFVVSFLFYFFGFPFTSILLVVTTVVSLEAIYLSIFAQMTLNKHSENLEDLQEDVGEIQEDVEGIQEDVEDIQEDVDEIQEDVEDIQENVDEIQEDVEDIQEEEDEEEKHTVAVDPEMLMRIEASLRELGTEIAELKRQSQEKKPAKKTKKSDA